MKNKLLKLMLSFLIIFSTSFSAVAVPVAAVENNSTEASDNTAASETKSRKEGEAPVFGDGEAAILTDAGTGNVLFEKDSTKRMYPASTTKVMTALLTFDAIEKGEISLGTEIEITNEMINGLDPDGSSMSLKVGEIITLENLLKGMLIPSGNDAACSIATAVGKSRAAFVDMMNAKALSLGCNDTHFANPDGLHDDNHYTTAADMAKIASAAMNYYDFRNIVDCVHIKIPPTNMSPERYYINTNGLLSTMRYPNFAYKGANGIKTGYTQKAGNCLVSSVKRDGMEFIGVFYGGKDVSDSHKGTAEMFDYAFEKFAPVTPISKGDMLYDIKVKQSSGSDKLALSASSSVTVVVPKGTNADEVKLTPILPDSVTAPVNAGDKVGSMSVTLNGQELATFDLIASVSVKRSFFWPVMAIGDFLWGNKIIRTFICLILIAAAAFVVIFIYAAYNNIKAAKKYNRRRQRRR